MSDTGFRFFRFVDAGNWVRLRTIILLRWWAIFGQIAAIVVAEHLYNLRFETGWCYLVIGVAVVGNLVAMFIFPETKRLTEFENTLMVLFDILQLAALLYLTGGLNNPFSILIVGPVTVSATALSTRSAIFLGLLAIALVSFLALFHLPLVTQSGAVFEMPGIFLFGNWAAIVIAVVFLGVYSRWIVSEMHTMSDALQATQLALAREQNLTVLGGVVAAAAHELGTPLATIKLTSAELADELDDRPDLRDDALLIRDQADRCRVILHSMGRAGKEDMHMKLAPLSSIVEEAAEPHSGRGKVLHFETLPLDATATDQPHIQRKAEIIHGLRNLIQNAVDFSKANVWIESAWSDQEISVRILDDGPGFPPQLLGLIGDPLLGRKARNSDTRRPEYEGMGLGLFIAKTLLERTGAELTFANGPIGNGEQTDLSAERGAVVEVSWPRAMIEADRATALGENRQIEI